MEESAERSSTSPKLTCNQEMSLASSSSDPSYLKSIGSYNRDNRNLLDEERGVTTRKRAATQKAIPISTHPENPTARRTLNLGEHFMAEGKYLRTGCVNETFTGDEEVLSGLYLRIRLRERGLIYKRNLDAIGQEHESAFLRDEMGVGRSAVVR